MRIIFISLLVLLSFVSLHTASAATTTEVMAAGKNIDIVYHRLSWHIDPAAKYIRGEVATLFVRKVATLGEVSFNLSNALVVDSVLYRGQRATFEHHFDHLAITIDAQAAENTIDSLTVFYQGIPNDHGTDAFVQSYHNEVPEIWTLSEPYGAMYWWPCKQYGEDKIDSIDIYITSPEQYRAASNGRLLTDETDNATHQRTAHWQHRHPISSYLIGIAVTNYSVFAQTIDLGSRQMEMVNYVYPEDEAEAREKIQKIIPVIQLYSKLFGEYPFADEKYGHAQFGWHGGMEHQTMSFVGNFDFELLIHELAHQWFGNYVTCGSWSDIWLNEGFATYLEGIAYENGLGEKTFDEWLNKKMYRAMSRPAGSVYVRDTTSTDRIFDGNLSYAKGAMLLHTVRGQIGDEAFFAAIRNYLNDKSLQNGYAHTSHLIEHLEATSGRELDEFFADWLYGEGYPRYALYWEQTNGDVTFNINQLQSSAATNFFEMQVPVKFVGVGADTTVWVQNDYSGQEYNFDFDFEVLAVQFDPEHKILTPPAAIYNRQQIAFDKFFKLIPNPTRQDVSVFAPYDVFVRNISVYNASGQLVQKNAFNDTGRHFKIDATDLPEGIYFLAIQCNGNDVVGRFVKSVN